MKKIAVVLMMLILAAGMVFASNTVTLNSMIAAGTGVTDEGTGNVIGGGEAGDGFWLKLAYYTDKNPTVREVADASEVARLTSDTSNKDAINDLTFVISYAGNPVNAGAISNITVATEGWKGIGTENSTERFPISLSYEQKDTAVDGLYASETASTGSVTGDNGETTVSSTFAVNYPSGLVAVSKQLATVKADWTKADNRKAGSYQATITVTVNGN